MTSHHISTSLGLRSKFYSNRESVCLSVCLRVEGGSGHGGKYRKRLKRNVFLPSTVSCEAASTHLLRDGRRPRARSQSRKTVIIVCWRTRGPTGPNCVGEFQGGTQLARQEELASGEEVGTRVGSLLLGPARIQIRGADPCLAWNQV